MAHEMTLLSAEVRTLRAANEALSKRRRAKKARVRQGGVLTIEDTQDTILQKDVDKQVRRDVRAAGGSRKEGQSDFVQELFVKELLLGWKGSGRPKGRYWQ